MKIVHHETVKQLVSDPNAPTGLKEQTIHRLSTMSRIGHPKHDEGGSPILDEEGNAEVDHFDRCEDGTFDVPDEVGHAFVDGPRPGWSVHTGDGPATVVVPEAPGRETIAALQAQVASLAASNEALLKRLDELEAAKADED